MAKPKTPKMPEGIVRQEAKALWRDVFARYELDGAALETLRVAVTSLDKYLRYSAQIEKEGATFMAPTGVIHKHPLAELIKNERAGFVLAMKLLDLQPEPDEKRSPGRPSRYHYGGA